MVIWEAASVSWGSRPANLTYTMANIKETFLNKKEVKVWDSLTSTCTALILKMHIQVGTSYTSPLKLKQLNFRINIVKQNPSFSSTCTVHLSEKSYTWTPLYFGMMCMILNPDVKIKTSSHQYSQSALSCTVLWWALLAYKISGQHSLCSDKWALNVACTLFFLSTASSIRIAWTLI